MPGSIFPHMIAHVTELAPLTDEQLDQITLYQEKAEDLAASQRKYQNIPMSRYREAPDGSSTNFKANTPEVDHILNLAIRFRFFYGDKEPTQFGKVINLLRRNAKDEWARSYLDVVSAHYKASMKATDTSGRLGHPITNREIINLWFNSKFFHSDTEKRASLTSVNQTVGEEASLFQLYVAIVKCSSHIQSLYSIVHKTDKENQIICTPKHHFRPIK